MKTVGHVESLWRYPVKSMRGEQLPEAFVGFSGVYGDRMYAFHSSASPAGAPFFSASTQPEMLLFRPRYRNPDRADMPPNLAAAQAIPPGITPLYATAAQLVVDVETPESDSLPIDDPRLIDRLRHGLGDRHELTLLRSDRALADCRPVSIFSLQTLHAFGQELGLDLDKRRFRANIYADLPSIAAFAENEFLGRSLRIGSKAVVAITDLDPRCKMITIDPDTAQLNPDLMRHLARTRDGNAGLYGAVVVEGIVRPGDDIDLLD
jgi:uncharacterized protein YcbX